MINSRDTTLLLKDEEIRKILSINPCIDAVEKAFKELATGVAKNLPRARIYTPTGQDEETLYWFNNLAGAVPSLDTMALRIDSRITKEVVVGGKKRKQLFGESGIGLVFVFKISTGELLAILDDPTLSPIRVGATSAVALRYLARKDASVLGLIGSGHQAKTQLQGAIAVMGGLKRINVFSMNFNNRDRFVHEMKGETPAEVIGVDDPKAAVSESDVVICATNSSEPVFSGRWLRKGTTVISIVGGDHTLKRREIDDVVLEKSRAIFVNSKVQIRLDEQATLFDPIKKELKRENVIFELGDLIKGNIPGRLDDEEIITYHNNCGMGIQFAAVGAVAYQRAIAAGVGRPLPAEWFRTSP